MKSFLRELLVTAVMAIVIFFVIQASVQTFIVVGTSMLPNFQDGQRVIVNKAVYSFGDPRHGDVIVFEPPNRLQVDYIKRVIGLPGDFIEIRGGAVYVNDRRLDEPYIKRPGQYSVSRRAVPDDSYFVLGDNRDNSNDSHYDWVVPRRNVIGKAWLSVWPPNLWGMASNYPLDNQLTAGESPAPVMAPVNEDAR